MAALTETAGTRRDLIFGNIRAVKGAFADVDDGDTWTPGLAIIDQVIVQNRTANPTASEVNTTVSTPANRQAVITFDNEAANQSLVVTAYGC